MSTPGTPGAVPVSAHGRAPRRNDDPTEIVDAITSAVLAVDGVAGMHQGAFGEVATYLPGRRVPGVRLRNDGSVEVHIVIRWGAPAPVTADAVRRVVRDIHGGRIDVTVGDIVTGGEPESRGSAEEGLP